MNTEPPILQGYAFTRLIGIGGTSTVFLYRKLGTNRHVAIKVSDQALVNAVNRQTFMDEIHFLSRLSEHPNILPILHAGITDDDRGYMILQYADGGTLKERMLVHPLSPDATMTMGIQLASALETAHRLGIVHRDVKPSNILLSSSNVPMLSDFGIAATIYSTGAAQGLSIPWAAPEVIQHQGGGDEHSDLYSLAATMFAMLTGSSPFEYHRHPKDLRELAQAITHDPLPQLNDNIAPHELVKTLGKAMSRDPEQRYHSVLQFARELQRIQLLRYGHQTPVAITGVSPLAAVQNTLPDPAMVRPVPTASTKSNDPKHAARSKHDADRAPHTHHHEQRRSKRFIVITLVAIAAVIATIASGISIMDTIVVRTPAIDRMASSVIIFTSCPTAN